MKFKKIEVTEEEYLKKVESWESFQAPFSGSDINCCVTAAKTILLYREQLHKEAQKNTEKKEPFRGRLTKYEPKSNIKIIFSKSGKAGIYPHLPKISGINGSKLGDYPQLQLPVAREKMNALKNGILINHTIDYVISQYDIHLEEKNKRNPERFGEGSVTTYQARTKNLKVYLGPKETFSNYTAGDLEVVLDNIVENFSASYSNEMFMELKRIWKFAKNKFNHGQNPAFDIGEGYVTSIVGVAQPCEAYTDLSSIAELWINLGSCTDIHQKNIIRFLILTGMRPINPTQLRWDWLNSITFPTLITFPASVMKNKKEFKLPVTQGMRAIILEQRAWVEEALPNCSDEYVFLQQKDRFQHFAKRSMDAVIKMYSPIDAVKGEPDKVMMKGSAGAYCTMCRSFAKSNIKGLLIKNGKEKLEAEALSRSALHHVRKSDDPNGENYDKSDKLYGTDTNLKRNVFKLHEYSIFSKVRALSGKALRQTGLEKQKEDRKLNNKQKNALRAEIKSITGKKGYNAFINQYIGDSEMKIKEIIHQEDGRKIIRESLEGLKLKQVT